jgi:hypothetical protein
MRRLYGRTSEAINSADEFLVITMEAAAGYPFDEIIQRLWLTLNDGQPLPDVWEEAAWSLQAFMVVSSFHRYYLPCVLPILSAVLDQSSMSKPSGNISNNLARLQAEDGWLVFRFSEHDNKCWSYQGTPVFTAHQRIAQRAWELRPMHWIDIGDKIIRASLIVPQSIRYVGHLAARCRISENNHDQSFVDNLVSKWSNDDNLSHIETRQLCELVAMLHINGQQNIALRFERILIVRAGNSSDGWLAALELYFLKNGKQKTVDFPETLDLVAIIACSDFSIAPNRASQFFSRLPKPLASLFIARLLNAFDGNLSWNLDSFLLAMLLRIAQYEMVNRISDIELWLKVHSNDTTVRNGYLGLLSKQELEKEQLDKVMRETEAWLEKH